MPKCKITMIGAGSVSFAPATINDILLSEVLKKYELSITLMDIDSEALEVSFAYLERAVALVGRTIEIGHTTDLDASLEGADFVVSAIEVDRYHYWSLDFHIPKRYGSRQVYGENGGPGGMFHFLRNIEPMLTIARRMEAICPDAFLINYTNPEAKLVEAILKLTKIKAVGVCHGFRMGVDQIARIIDMDADVIDAVGYGLNHFGWYTRLTHRETGEDLYPLLRAKEKNAQWLADWDALGLSRIMFRTYGLYPYPGTNHIGEYVGWADSFLASSQIQYFYDPAEEDPWAPDGKTPRFVYDFSSNPTAIAFDQEEVSRDVQYRDAFGLEDGKLWGSGEYGVPIMEAILGEEEVYFESLNILNQGQLPGVMQGACIEAPVMVGPEGLRALELEALPTAVAAMINQQAAITQLLIEAYQEGSKRKLLQAVLLDPTVSTYHQAVHMINELCEREQALLPPLEW